MKSKLNPKSFFYRTLAVLMIVTVALAAMPATPAQAAACTFTSAGSGNWTTITWTRVGAGCSTYPGQTFAGDIVVISNNNTVTLNVSPVQPIASITFPSGNAVLSSTYKEIITYFFI